MNRVLPYVAVLSASSLLGCGADVVPQGGALPSGDSPVAVAADDQTVDPGSWVRLDGSASYDPQGLELDYMWSQVGGPLVELSSWRTPVASFTAPATEPSEALVFQLEVDNGQGTAEATTLVRVIQGEPPPPGGEVHADAGPDQGVQPGDWVLLDGSASRGMGDEPLEFEWRQLSGIDVELADADQAVAGFEAPDVEELEALVLQLQVTQGSMRAADEVTIIVVAEEGGGGEGDSPQCSDGIDNDDDELIDFPEDPGCVGPDDDNEFNNPPRSPACADDIDNDGDGLIDYPADPGCDSAEDEDEYNEPLGPACSDGRDNDGDGLIDFPADPGCYGTADDDELDTERRPLLLTNLADPDAVKARRDEWGVQKAIIFGEWCIQMDDDFHWSEEERTERTDYCLESGSTDPDFDGYIALDWEGDPFYVLREGADHPLHAETMNEFLRVLEYVRAKRPLAKVGYYLLPFREYWHQDEDWLQALDDARPLFDASSAFFPSVYDFYGCSDDPDHHNYQCAFDHERYGNMLRKWLEIAEGKPVLLYTMHRYHNSTEEWGSRMIAEDEYIEHARHLLHNVEYNGDYADGVVAWGADQWYYDRAFETEEDGSYTRTGSGADRTRQYFWDNMEPDETIDEFLTRLYPRLYSNLRQALEGD